MKIFLNTNIFFTAIFISTICFSCKCKQNSSAVESENKTHISSQQNTDYIHATGKISLQNKSACGVEIISITGNDTLILIPMPALTGFEREGAEVSFSYRKLRVHNPKGCSGMPVQIAEIKKK